MITTPPISALTSNYWADLGINEPQLFTEQFLNCLCHDEAFSSTNLDTNNGTLMLLPSLFHSIHTSRPTLGHLETYTSANEIAPMQLSPILVTTMNMKVKRSPAKMLGVMFT
mmetsp:Transcript_2748/g.7194  ORF Transcript_2748/g.7194 Transcript_2748/m.7194 type:complete len:112 (+) Transcript_2748:89-424(+)